MIYRLIYLRRTEGQDSNLQQEEVVVYATPNQSCSGTSAVGVFVSREGADRCTTSEEIIPDFIKFECEQAGISCNELQLKCSPCARKPHHA